MKKLFVLAALAIAMLSLNVFTSQRAEARNLIVKGSGWKKSDAGTWPSMDNKTWYKLNTKDASLWMSTDGKTWAAASTGMWQDKDGKWLKIVDMKLKWSADNGATWSDVPDWTWQGGDGNWYKFDSSWNLWMKKGM